MKWAAAAIAAFAFTGMADSLYLSFSHRSGPVPCHVTHGCNDVLTSRYSEIGGIPISWAGVAFYLTAFALAVFELSGTRALRLLRLPAAVAFLVSLALVGIQAFVLQAFCEYCLLSALLSTAIFFTTLYATATP